MSNTANYISAAVMKELNSLHGALTVALVQVAPTDDQIIVGHMRDALAHADTAIALCDIALRGATGDDGGTQPPTEAAEAAIDGQPRTPEWRATYNAAIAGILASTGFSADSPARLHALAADQADHGHGKKGT